MGVFTCSSQKGPRFIQSNEQISRKLNRYGATIAIFETMFKPQKPTILEQRITECFIFVSLDMQMNDLKTLWSDHRHVQDLFQAPRAKYSQAENHKMLHI